MTAGTCGWLRSFRKDWTLTSASHYRLALAMVLTVLVVKFFLPQLLENEAGKLVCARQILDPSFLSRDWVQARGFGDSVLDPAFAALIAPLWLWLRNGILVALAARLLCWGILLFALVKLARTLSIEWYALSCCLGIWICEEQTLGAYEWVFGGAEAKCLAYALLLFALEAVLRKRVLTAGICCGLATCFHVMVGGWGSIALGGALLLRHRDYAWQRTLQFVALAACLGTLIVTRALLYAAPGSPAEHQASDRLMVLFVDPFHLDPAYFHGKQELVLASILAAGASWAFYKITTRPQAALLRSLLAVLVLEFSAGLLAWKLSLFWYLKAFPFRVPDTLIFLFFLLALPCLVMRHIAKLGKQVGRDGFRPRSVREWSRLALLLGLLGMIGGRFLWDLNTILRKDLPDFMAQWQQYVAGQRNSWQEMTDWIRANTPKSAVIMAPPWEYGFWIDAERAEVVSYKRPPHNVHVLEWNRRMTALNGRPFQLRGSGILRELRQNYPGLSLSQIETVRNVYHADYYLTTRRRDDLRGNLVHVTGSHYLYDLRKHHRSAIFKDDTFLVHK